MKACFALLLAAGMLAAQNAGPITRRPPAAESENKPPPPFRRKPAPLDRRTGPARGDSQARGVVSDAELIALANNQRVEDPVIAEARRANLSFSSTLPNYICDQTIDRFASKNLGRKWTKSSVVESEVLLIGHEERYQNIRIDGREAGDDMTLIEGPWSTGEFATILTNLFREETWAQFERVGPDTINDRALSQYDFHVEKDYSRWALHINSQTYLPEYQGQAWIDESSGRVYRVQKEALYLPADYPLITVETDVEYDWVTIDSQQYLMPATANVLSCVRGSARCFKNEIAFSSYRKFTAASTVFNTESTIDFGGEAPPNAEPEN